MVTTLTQPFPLLGHADKTWMPRLAFAPKNRAPRGDMLVVIFLRGAADVLNMVVPQGEEAYYQLRPSLGIPRPDDTKATQTERVIDLDGFFGLHPALGSLLDAWQSQHLAIIHACGAPDESRSHFNAAWRMGAVLRRVGSVVIWQPSTQVTHLRCARWEWERVRSAV
jgi:uncharacterized protein (DUF1501 family)